MVTTACASYTQDPSNLVKLHVHPFSLIAKGCCVYINVPRNL